MKYQERMLATVLGTLLLAACGGGGGGESSSAAGTPSTPVPAVPVNVALPANGATVSATYGGSTKDFVNDGDTTTTTNFWAGNIGGDTVTVDFGKLRNVTDVTVYTNDTSFSSSNPSKYIEVSADNASWKKTAQVVGGDVACASYVTGTGKISCTFSTAQSIRYLRVRVTAVSPGNEHVVEIQATGT